MGIVAGRRVAVSVEIIRPAAEQGVGTWTPGTTLVPIGAGRRRLAPMVVRDQRGQRHEQDPL
jgi:hypothetical protein